ncbi:unnamed protein product [Thlaspi arvense]|uniref:Uncharacterized protein n=1 Tax=Thlaspi arvense TaxID=13288 RepID=A0AAU9SGT2_THLAR|nr:unnamed protein product [Thlaspi arvense]
MADSSSLLPPLCERMSCNRFVPRALDLTILGLLCSLLLYQILHINQNGTVWVMAFLRESSFFFMWLLFSNVIWSPVKHKPYPDRLDKRLQDVVCRLQNAVGRMQNVVLDYVGRMLKDGRNSLKDVGSMLLNKACMVV